MNQILKSTWPLFLGVCFLMLGNGLQGTLIGWRGAYEGFSGSNMGIIMAGYFLGFMIGSKFAQPIVQNVGHVRVFAALASMASTAILLQIVIISEPVWFAMRVVTGFCFAGSYVVVESWLNASATNVTRGGLFSIYMIVTFASMTAGQWLFNVGDPSGYNLFICASILLSISLVPLLLSNRAVPAVSDSENMGLRKLYRISPAGVSGLFFIGISQGIMFTMGAVYAKQVGLSTAQIATFMSVMIAFGAVSQWPLGKLSDMLDRRWVIMGASAVATLACVLLLQMGPGTNQFFLMYGVFGAMNLPLYSLAVAHSNDRLEPDQMVAASSTLVFTFGLGSILGPLTMGFIFDYAGSQSYFIYLALIHSVLTVLTLFYMIRREAAPEEDHVQYQAIPPRGTVIALEAIAQHAEHVMDEESEDQSEANPEDNPKD